MAKIKMDTRTPNDGKMAWKASQNDYVDGRGNRLGALGSLVLFDFNTMSYGWTKFEKGVPGLEKFFPQPDNVDQAFWDMIDASKPKTLAHGAQINDAYRVTVRNATIRSRSLTILESSTGSVKALKGLMLDYINAPGVVPEVRDADGNTGTEAVTEADLGKMPIVLLTSKKMIKNDGTPFLSPQGEEMWNPVFTIKKWVEITPQPVPAPLSNPISVDDFLKEQDDNVVDIGSKMVSNEDSENLLASRIERMKLKRNA